MERRISSLPDSASVLTDQREGLETKSDRPSDCLFETTRYQAHVFGSSLPAQQHLASLLFEAATKGLYNLKFAKYLPLQKVATKLLDCSRAPVAMFDKQAVEFHMHEFRCRQRICIRCTAARSFDLRASLEPITKELNSPRFLTLSLKSSDDPLKHQLQRLTKSFAKLRATKLWKAHVDGGLYTIEVTHNKKTNQWHPHLHAIIDGVFLPQKQVVSAWLKATGDSTIVDIRPCRDRRDALYYITKYVSKTNDVAQFPDHKIPEWTLAIRGLRFVSTFGTLRGKKLIDDEEKPERERTEVGYIAPLGLAANHGDDRATELWEAVVREATVGPLPLEAKAKERCIEKRFRLYNQLTLWLGHYAETGESLQDLEPKPPPDLSGRPHIEPALFDRTPTYDP